MSEINLRRIKFGVSQALSDEMLAVAQSLEVVEHKMVGNVVYAFRAAMFGQQTTREIRYPRDWCQAVKARWLPAWAKKRWPVVYTVHSINAQRLLPDFVPAPQLGRVIVRLEEQQRSEYWTGTPPEVE